MNNILLLILILIICSIIFYFCFDNKRLKESFYNFDSNKNTPNFITEYENNIISNDPDYSHENITQYDFNRLYKKLQKVNKEKIKFDDYANYSFYTQSTTEDLLRRDLDIISEYVILILNDDNYYDFSKTNYGDVEKWVDKDGNENFKYELFIWDKKNYFQLKVMIDIIKFIEDKDINRYGVKDKKYIFPYYNIGTPFKDQLIPLPEDVIITAHLDTDLKSEKPNNPKKIKYLYLNQISIQNSTLIVDYNKDKYDLPMIDIDENRFSGITDSSLEYIKIKGDTTPYIETVKDYNKWPTLDSEPKWLGQYPSKMHPETWDLDGIYYYNKKENKDNTSEICSQYNYGTRWSQQKEELQPNFWASNYTVASDCGENFWLFDNANGTNGTFVGGGKR